MAQPSAPDIAWERRIMGLGDSVLLPDSSRRIAVVGTTSNRAGIVLLDGDGEVRASTALCSPTSTVYSIMRAVGDRAGRVFLFWDTPEVRCVSIAPGLTSVSRLDGGWPYDSFRSAVPDESGGVYAAFEYTLRETKYINYFGCSSNDVVFPSPLTGDSHGALVARARTGQLYLVGSQGWSRYASLRILSYEPTGELLWDKQLPGPTNEFASAVACDSAGNLLIVGSHRGAGGPGPGSFRPVLLKMTPGGTLSWRAVLTNSGGHSALAVSSANEIYASGWNGIFKYSPNGHVIWHNPEPSSHLRLTPENKLIVAAPREGATVLRKLASSGEEKWRTEVAHDSSDEWFSDIAVDAHGDVYVATIIWHYPEGPFPRIPLETVVRKYVEEPWITVIKASLPLPELTTCEPAVAGPCDIPPSPPPADVTSTLMGRGRMLVCWPTNYADYRLEATRRVNRRNPDRTRWHPVTETRTTNAETCCVVARIARHGRTFRIVPP